MITLRTVTTVAAAAAIVSLATLPLSALSHRFGMLTLGNSFGLLATGIVLAVIVLAGSLYLLVVTFRRGLRYEGALAGAAMLVSVLQLAFIGFEAYRAFTLPLIHDITTNGIDVPTFDVAHELRGEGDHPLTYGSDRLAPGELWITQKRAYPGIQTLRTSLDTSAAFERAVDVLTGMGLEIVNEDRDAGRIEAVATTFWFGFKDDVVVRVRSHARGTDVDVRSVSRIGQSDLGANAARIRRILQALEE